MPINQDVTVTLPGGGKSKVIGSNLVDPIYGNQFIRKMSGKQGGTFESTARGVRANGIVRGNLPPTLPSTRIPSSS